MSFINLTKTGGKISIQGSEPVAKKEEAKSLVEKIFGSKSDQYGRPNLIHQAYRQVAQTVTSDPEADPYLAALDEMDARLQRFR